VPSPWRTSSTRITDSALTASRSELRETPIRSDSSFSGGSRSPGFSSPSTTICLMAVMARSVTAEAMVLFPSSARDDRMSVQDLIQT
jgi:hypothetical protein